jgi:PAS domain S-box-containing protein
MPQHPLRASHGLAPRRAGASAEPALEVLALAAAPFSEPGLDLGTALLRVARAVADLLGDACVVRLLSLDGAELVPVALHHREPARLASLQRLLAAGPASAREGAYAMALASDRPLSFETSDARLVPQGQARALREAGVARLMLAALRTSRGPVGTIGFNRDDPALPFTAMEAALLQALAGRAALSIENARLLEEERRARAEAEIAAWALREKVGELETAETRFRAAFEGTSLGMAVLTPRWEILQANDALTSFLGHKADRLVGSPFLGLVHAADDAGMREDAKALGYGRRSVTSRRRLVRHDGEPVWATVTATLVLDHSEQPHAVVVHVYPHAATAPEPAPPAAHAGPGDLAALGRILHNPVNIDLLRRLHERPGHPRALAQELGRSEGDVQRKLRALEQAGLVASAWRHHAGATVKEYQAVGRVLRLSLAG